MELMDFWILKDGNSVTDSSPNSNNFTVAAGNTYKNRRLSK